MQTPIDATIAHLSLLHLSGGEACGYGAHTNPVAALTPGDGKVSSAFRGLCHDQGKQRHVGRFKNEVVAARAYDKAAYYLYGAKAILNFSMQDAMADPSEVPNSIRQAKAEGATPGGGGAGGSGRLLPFPWRNTNTPYGSHGQRCGGPGGVALHAAMAAQQQAQQLHVPQLAAMSQPLAMAALPHVQVQQLPGAGAASCFPMLAQQPQQCDLTASPTNSSSNSSVSSLLAAACSDLTLSAAAVHGSSGFANGHQQLVMAPQADACSGGLMPMVSLGLPSLDQQQQHMVLLNLQASAQQAPLVDVSSQLLLLQHLLATGPQQVGPAQQPPLLVLPDVAASSGGGSSSFGGATATTPGMACGAAAVQVVSAPPLPHHQAALVAGGASALGSWVFAS